MSASTTTRRNITVVLVFVPLENLLEDVKNLLKTLGNESGTDYAVIGWCYKKHFWTQLETEMKKQPHQPLFVMKQAENVGKAQLINLAMDKIETFVKSPLPQYVSFCDCDLNLAPGTIETLLACADQVPNLGLISSNQSANNSRHSFMDEDPVVILENNQRIIIPELVTAVSGGLFAIPYDIWFEVGPLPTIALYYNEEAILNLRLSFLDKVVCVASYVVAEHPGSKVSDYDEWKLKQCLEEHYIMGPHEKKSECPYVLVGPDQCKVYLKFPAAADTSSKYKNKEMANCVQAYRNRYQASLKSGHDFWTSQQKQE